MKKIYGLLGKSLHHSISPLIHDLIFKKLNINGTYKLFEETNNLKQALNNISKLGIIGINVTIPYKIDIMKYLNEISLEAQKIKSVNTIYFKESLIKGFNTDYYGFQDTLQKMNIIPHAKKVVVLGTGGSALSVCHCFLDNNVKDIVMASRNKLVSPIKDINIINYNALTTLKNWDIIINTTPVGMYPAINFSPVDDQIIKNFSTAIDLIYNPKETKFIQASKKLGLRYSNGLYMLISQAAASQEIWQGDKINKDIVETIYHELK